MQNISSEEYVKIMQEEEKNFVLNNFNLEEIYEFTLKHKVEIIVQSDYNFNCFIDYKEGDGCWAAEINPLSALIIGIKKYKENEDLHFS